MFATEELGSLTTRAWADLGPTPLLYTADVQISQTTNAGAPNARGTVVVVDVVRAFTTAAYALAAGARDIVLVSTVEEALQLQQRFPGSLTMGEVKGEPIAGFDFGNSPAALAGRDLHDRRLIQRTSNGTQGMVRSRAADRLFAGSFVCADATARQVRAQRPSQLSFVITGLYPGSNGDEDVALADYLSALLRDQPVDPEEALRRVREADWSRRLARTPELRADLSCCAEIDRFDFAMEATWQEDLLVLRAVRDGGPGR